MNFENPLKSRMETDSTQYSTEDFVPKESSFEVPKTIGDKARQVRDIGPGLPQDVLSDIHDAIPKLHNERKY